MAMADHQSEDSSIHSRTTKRRRKTVNSEVDEFIKSLVPGKQLTKVDTTIQKPRGGKDFGAEIFKLIESM